MESGRPRVRAVDRECLEVMNVTWNFTGDQYKTFQDFFVNELEHGALVFELITLEHASDPTQIRQYVREVAFLDATYTFSGSDNLFVVEAVLEIDAEEFTYLDNPFVPRTGPPPPPEIPYTFTSTCWDTIEFIWPLLPTFQPQDDVLETAASEDGPWFEYIVAVPTEEQLTAGLLVLLVNNSFNGERWFRVLRNGKEIYGPTNPVGSVVPMPASVTINNTVESPYGLHETPRSGGIPLESDMVPFTRPVSYIENSLLNPTAVYVEPVKRLEYDQGVAASGPTNAVTATIGEGSELRWTRDGSDPTLEMVWPPPKYEGVDYNARVYWTDFTFALRLRCFSGECKSPLAIVLVDRRHDLGYAVETLGPRKQYGQSCDLPRELYPGGPMAESGLSCAGLYGGEEEFYNFVDSAACDNASGNFNLRLGSPLKHAIYSRNWDTSEGTSYMGWPAVGATASRWLISEFSPTGFRVTSYWDVVPKVYEYAIATVGLVEPRKELIAGPGQDGLYQAGPGGTLVDHCDGVEEYLLAFVPACVGKESGSLVLTSFEVLLSLQNDNQFTVPTTPPSLPDPPEPPTPTTVFEELWESYVDTEAAELAVLNDGTGWNGAWVFHLLAVVRGNDLWDDYSDQVVEEDTELAYGEGWNDAWTFHNFETQYEETWQSYTDQVVDMAAPPTLAGGVGWEWLDEDAGIMKPWVFHDNLMGAELWESYADQVVTGATVLNYNGDLSWAGQWVFAGT